ncbi:MAG: glycosyltransferase [Muribaculaceae bacterium]|nr:glycosyltransferase [Muribaculaceae bacterium]
MTKISVIIPVYNTAALLPRCLESILNQTYNNYEVICINDGSTDNSLSVLKEYAKGYKNLVILSQPNQGVSVARNTGLDHCTGDYITFIDSDDYVDKEYLTTLITSSSGESYDLICSGLTDFCDDGVIHSVNLQPAKIQLSTSGNIIGFLETLLNTSPVAKLYRREIILKNNIRFSRGLSLGEDREFNLKYFVYCDKILTCNYSGYFYRKDVVNSLTHQRHTHVLLRNYEAIKLKEQVFKAKNTYDEKAKKFIYSQIINLLFDELTSLSTQPTDRELVNEFNSVVSAIGDNWNNLKEYSYILTIPKWLKWLFLNKKFKLVLLSLSIRKRQLK